MTDLLMLAFVVVLFSVLCLIEGFVVRRNDPVKNCELYKDKCCAHVDGMLCDFPGCSMNLNYIKEKEEKDE